MEIQYCCIISLLLLIVEFPTVPSPIHSPTKYGGIGRGLIFSKSTACLNKHHNLEYGILSSMLAKYICKGISIIFPSFLVPLHPVRVRICSELHTQDSPLFGIIL